MAYQSINRENRWISPEAADQLNTMIESIEKKVTGRETTYDIPVQTVQHIDIPGASSNSSFLRSNHILTLSFTVKDTSASIRLPVDVSGRWAIKFTSSKGYSFPALIEDSKITFPFKPAIEGPYDTYTVIVV